jgi:hypothetical protein
MKGFFGFLAALSGKSRRRAVTRPDRFRRRATVESLGARISLSQIDPGLATVARPPADFGPADARHAPTGPILVANHTVGVGASTPLPLNTVTSAKVETKDQVNVELES